MSEYSESYHLKVSKQEEAIELLQRANVGGYVFPVTNGWVTMVVDGEFTKLNSALIEANSGCLLNYQYAGDHGWGFSLFEGSAGVSSYFCSWEEGLEIGDEDLNLEATSNATGIAEDALKNLLYPQNMEIVLDSIPAHQFVEQIGLQYYEWLAAHYMEQGEDEYLKIAVRVG